MSAKTCKTILYTNKIAFIYIHKFHLMVANAASVRASFITIYYINILIKNLRELKTNLKVY